MTERIAPADDPVALTVHAMPSPARVLDEDAQRTRSGRWKMLLLALVCAAPVIASYFSYYVVRPDGRRNFGTLIDPQQAIPVGAAATDLNGQPFDLMGLKGQWLLVTVGGGACDARCESNLYLQRQLREALGKDKDRIDRVWLVPDQARVPDVLEPALHQATVVRVPSEVVARWMAPEAGHALNEHLYVVDPMGHWMMRFPASLDRAGAARAKRDLVRLMRASASWDRAGRAAP
ncbi:SCO family protein [Ottowia sp.]|uniref:SCO family protein n=1 Tax=Ottowia sp. TaxID=1898956 RepID=UPI003A87A30C